ncbi:hypothetical protein [Chondromyces apiculatus]|nr:hypothetical protein [Chondromyces apiculatus]
MAIQQRTWVIALTVAGALSASCSPGGDGAQVTPTSSISSSGGGPGTGGEGGAGAAGGAGQGGEGGQALPSPCPPDADGDGISDAVEGTGDTDGDGIPDAEDLDSDGDTIPDAIEGQTASLGCAFPQDSDGDGTPDFQDTDSDSNGLPDRQEVYPDGQAYDPARAAPNPADTDGDGIPDYADPDNDGDSLPDTVELDTGARVDTDSDGTPDLDDLDSDGDGIADLFEGVTDPDGDGVPAFRDSDSDGDGIPDACEVLPGHTLADPPPDTDNDGRFNHLDVDADGDGLPDSAEDLNGSCTLDPGETSPTIVDTDGDGTSDFIEVTLASDPADPQETPATLGKSYFVLPYLLPAEPLTRIIPLRTRLSQGDVAFLVDTTATMGGEIANLKAGMATIIQQLYQDIPDLAVGVAGFDDFPTGTSGTPGQDLPFYVAGTTGHVSTTLSNNLAAVQALNVHDGRDFPESQVAAMQRALTGQYLIWDSGQMTPSVAPPGRYGSLHFRPSALPILVLITDASFHNGRRASNPTVLHDPYPFNDQPPFPTPTIDTLITEMNARGARFVGISVSDGVRTGADPYEDLAYLADQTGSYVPPSVFGGAQCATGLGGTFVATPDGPASAANPGGTCRLVFDVTTNGSGVSTSVVSGVQALLRGIKLDLRVLAAPDGSSVDAVDSFIETVRVNASGGNDEAEPGVPCLALNALEQLADFWTGPKGLVHQPDGVNESARGVVPGQKICFQVVPKSNTTLPQQAMPQVFKATLSVKARVGTNQNELLLGTPREIAFIVPPSPQ